MQLFANNVETTLVASLSSSATTMYVASSSGMPEPTGGDYFLLTLCKRDSNGAESNIEIVKCTAVVSNELTIVRAQEDTTGTEYESGDIASLRLTAGTLNDNIAAIEANTAKITCNTANVDAAGATMETDADVSSNTWVLDEDNMSSNSATKVPTQQSVKTYVDNLQNFTVFNRTCILVDELGYSNLMVRIPKFRLEDIDASLGTGIHPAFIVNGVEEDCIYVSKYQANLIDGVACSQPNQDQIVSVDFDQALTYCANKGSGWHLLTNAEWAAIALWCWKNNTMPHGNNNYGQDIDYAYETGRLTNSTATLGSSGVARTANGSGPVTWSHEHTPDGIYDLNGNIHEWVGGLRIYDGEIQVIENNNAADNTIDQSSTSGAWSAILASDGSLVTPGTSGTLKYDALNTDGSGGIQIDDVVDNQSDGTTYASNTFETIVADSGITIPNILKQLALAPAVAGLGNDLMQMRNVGERLPMRGGSYYSNSSSGVFSLNLNDTRTLTGTNIGFRFAFI